MGGLIISATENSNSLHTRIRRGAVVKAWAVVKDDYVFIFTVRRTRADSRLAFMEGDSVPWDIWLKRGYSCKRVKIEVMR